MGLIIVKSSIRFRKSLGSNADIAAFLDFVVKVRFGDFHRSQNQRHFRPENRMVSVQRTKETLVLRD